MDAKIIMLAAVVGLTGCQRFYEVDTTPPVRPQGVQALALDKSVEVSWLSNSDADLAGYNVWSSDRYDGKYVLLGSTNATRFVDSRIANGETKYYAVSSYDFDKNESGLSTEVAVATARPEGFGVPLVNFRTAPNLAGYDFSTYSIGKYNDNYTDVFFENDNGRLYLDVWNDTDIQDMGYTSNFDEITQAPTAGWSPLKSAEAIVGHTYVVWTHDDHYAKMRVKEIDTVHVVFDWSYQTVKSVTALKRDLNAGSNGASRFRDIAH
ncbi:MAG: hypothetical protein HY966_05270 [Ignavibacteriales bacterium]|nr:hypothetical protein [Ignavibacteriales bacterium]